MRYHSESTTGVVSLLACEVRTPYHTFLYVAGLTTRQTVLAGSWHTVGVHCTSTATLTKIASSRGLCWKTRCLHVQLWSVTSVTGRALHPQTVIIFQSTCQRSTDECQTARAYGAWAVSAFNTGVYAMHNLPCCMQTWSKSVLLVKTLHSVVSVT